STRMLHENAGCARHARLLCACITRSTTSSGSDEGRPGGSTRPGRPGIAGLSGSSCAKAACDAASAPAAINTIIVRFMRLLLFSDVVVTQQVIAAAPSSPQGA